MPTPSMAAMRVGEVDGNPASGREKRPPKPPIVAGAPGRAVDFKRGEMRETRELPEVMETPAEA